MLRPVDLQVLITRTIEVQKQQGVAARLAGEEGENFRRRLQHQVEEEQRQVQRKSNVLTKRVNKRQEKDETNQQGQQRERKKEAQNPLGQNVDLEM
jgi:hypothetical protein